MMGRDEVLTMVADAAARCAAAVFVGNGLNARALLAVSDSDRHFAMMGSMGLCPALAAGYSHVAGRPVFAVEGDGNALMGLSGWPVVPVAARAPFVHVVLNNDGYESTGRQRSPAPMVSFPGVARAAGYGAVFDVDEPGSLRRALAAAVAVAGTALVHVRTSWDDGPVPARVPYHPRAVTARFMAAFDTRPAAAPSAAPSTAPSTGADLDPAATAATRTW